MSSKLTLYECPHVSNADWYTGTALSKMLIVAEIAASLLLIPLGIYSKNVVGWLLQDHLILKIQLLIVFDALHMAILFTDIFYYSKI